MPTRLLVEGPSIEDVLARVRAEHGESARIVQADKVRTGGIGGFFAKERYEVQVEVDEPALVPPALDSRTALKSRVTEQLPAAQWDSGLGILGLIGEADAGDEVPVPQPRPAVPAAAPVVDEPLVSTDSPAFARILAALSRDAEPPAEVAFSPAPFRSVHEAMPETVQRPVDEQPTDEQPTDEQPGPAEHAANLADLRERALFEAVIAEGMSLSPLAPPAPVAVADVAVADVEVATLPDIAPAAEAAPAPEVAPQAPLGPRARLARAGVPERLLARVPESAAGRLETAAASVAELLPAAAPCTRAAGTVAVVVGEGQEAYLAARTLAASLGLEPDVVVLMARTPLGLKVSGARYVDSRASLLRRLPRWRAAEVPTVVAVDSSFDPVAAAWAREVVEMTSPETVWALVDASRKTAATVEHLRAMEAVDALVVTHAASTATPGEVLSLNIPVAVVDGEAASAARWAALLATAAKEEAR